MFTHVAPVVRTDASHTITYDTPDVARSSPAEDYNVEMQGSNFKRFNSNPRKRTPKTAARIG
jgi:hypothetical protein